MIYSPVSLPEDIVPPNSNKDVNGVNNIEEWCKSYLRYYLYNYYNRMIGFSNAHSYIEQLPIVEKGLVLSKYLVGKQSNYSWLQFTKDLDGKTLPYKWQAGKELATIFGYHRGIYNTQLGNKKIAALSLSRDVILKRNAMIEASMLQGDNEFMSVVKNTPGLIFAPLGENVRINSPEQGAKMGEKNFKDKVEEDMVKIAYDIQERNYTNEIYRQCFTDMYAYNYAGVYTYVEDGRVKQRNIPADSLFWEKRDNDPLNRRMSGAGFIEYMTLQEIVNRWNLSKESADLLKSRQSSPEMLNSGYYSWDNLSWYKSTGRYNTIGVVYCFFIAPRNYGKERIVDKYGNVNYVKPKKESDGLVMNDLYYCILAGNEVVLECGLANNVVESKDNKSDVDLPISVIDFFNVSGDGSSICNLMFQLQDNLDFLRYKINEFIAKGKGMVHIMDGSVLNSISDNPIKMANDFTSMGFTVVNGASGDYADVGLDGKKLIHTLDMRIDGLGLNAVVNQYIQDRNTMDRIAGLGAVVTGQQNFYVSENVRKGTIEASYIGLSYLLQMLNEFEEKNLQYACNLFKMLKGKEGSELDVIIGKEGLDRIKLLRDVRWEDILIFVKTNDTIDEGRQERIMQLLMAYQNNPTPESADGLRLAIQIMRSETYNEAENKLDDFLEKAQIAKEEQAIAQAQMMQDKSATSERIVDKQTAAQLEATKMNAEAKLASKELELDSKEREGYARYQM